MTGTLRVEANSTTGGLVLRPWRTDDVEDVIEAFGDPAIAKWANPPITTREDALRWLDMQSQDQENGVRLAFAVIADQPGLGEGELLGNVVVKWHELPGGGARRAGGVGDIGKVGGVGGGARGDAGGVAGVGGAGAVTGVGGVGGVGEIGYWTMPHARGRGIAPRVVEALSTWAFDTFAAQGLHRLELIHQVDNLASCRVAEKSGYRLDRILPAYPPYPMDGHIHVRDAGR
ncbi:GNAT family N-acetyltransferase [Streptomyces sp. NBC_00442]|uniref:GNAT family N-acetyltransferase n=1 Tax=Streptomyces sp. NBC_00442 TaxID=2903651 RepID=UPI002E1F63FA